MDHVNILLRERNVRFPGREQLRLRSSGEHPPGGKWDKHFAMQRHFSSPRNKSISRSANGRQNRPSGLDLDQTGRIRSAGLHEKLPRLPLSPASIRAWNTYTWRIPV